MMGLLSNFRVGRHVGAELRRAESAWRGVPSATAHNYGVLDERLSLWTLSSVPVLLTS
jgi:hypothetical protein